MIAAVVLAAGASRRLGEPKQLIHLDHDSPENLLERAVRLASDAQCAPVIVVVGCNFPLILGRSELGDAVPVINDEWQEGMAASIRLGIRTCRSIARQAEGVLLMTCDQPAVTLEHLQLLVAGTGITASEYEGRRGVPAYFPAADLEELMALRGDAGARELLRAARSIALAGGELDIDTVEELARARELFGLGTPPSHR